MPSPRKSSPITTGTYELPQQFAERIREQFPEEYPEFLLALDVPPATSIRLNPHKWKWLVAQSDFPNKTPDAIKHITGTNASPVPWTQNGWFLRDRPSFTLDPLFHAGCYYVQEAGSMVLEHVLSLPELRENSDLILDSCAAPGGKSTLIAAMFPKSLIVANEVIRSRIPALLENCTKWGTGNLVVTQSDPVRFTALEAFFDLAVVDAPCSGEGLFRKNPPSRMEWSPDNAHHCALRQRTILMDTWKAIRPGGHLIYTTCTFNPEENEHNVAWLLEQTDGDCVPVPGGMMREIRVGNVTGYGLYPHRSQGEGFFLSVIRKPAPDGNLLPRRPYIRAKHIIEPEPFALKKTSEWLTTKTPMAPLNHPTGAPSNSQPGISADSAASTDSDFRQFQIRDRLFRIRSNHWNSLHILSSQLPVRYAGTEIAGIIRDDVRPAAAAALDMHLNCRHFPKIACTRDDALRFLRRESLPVPESADTGWHLATFHSIPLGWLKNIGRRMNNYHPKEWRIRQF